MNIVMTAALGVGFLFLLNGKIDKSEKENVSQLKLLRSNRTFGKKYRWNLIKQYVFCLAAEPPAPGRGALKSGSFVYLRRCDPRDPLQHFRYDKATGRIVSKMKSKSGALLCLDVYGVANGYIGSVQLYNCKSSDKSGNQQWELGGTSGKEKHRIVSKYRTRSMLCLTSRNKDALASKAWHNFFSNMPQQFKDYHKQGNDHVAVRQCANNYRFFYTRMQRWRMASPSDFDTHAHATSHDGVTILLTVQNLQEAGGLVQDISYMYTGIDIVILSGGELTHSEAADFHARVIHVSEAMDDETALVSAIHTPYVLVMGVSNRLMPDFDIYSLVEALDSDPTVLAAAGFLQDDKTLYRPCYTAMKVPVQELSALKLASDRREATLSTRTVLQASKTVLSQLAFYRAKARGRSRGTGVLPEVNERQTRFPKNHTVVTKNAFESDSSAGDEAGRKYKKVWVEGYFKITKGAAMACDRSSKPVMVRKADLMDVVGQDILDLRIASAQGGGGGGAKWKPKELVTGKVMNNAMRRIAVVPEFRSRTTAYTCTKDSGHFTPLDDCFAPPDDMETPLALEDAWSESSPCRKVPGVDEKRDKMRGFSEALEVFGRSIHEISHYFMDGTLLGLIKLGTFAPWDSDGDIMLQMPGHFKNAPKEVEEFTRMLYMTMRSMQLSVEETERKNGKLLAYVNPTTFHLYIPLENKTWVSSWHSVCKKNADYTINEPWESCLKKLKNETLIYTRGYSSERIQTDLHLTFPNHVFGKSSKLAGNLRVADRDFFHYIPYHFIETLHWWYDQERMLRNPWDCEWRHPLFYPPYSRKPNT